MDNLSAFFVAFSSAHVSLKFLKRETLRWLPRPRKRPYNYEAKECNRWSNTENIIERTKRTEEQKKEKKKENHTRTLFLVFDASSFTPNQQTHEFFTTKRLFDFVLRNEEGERDCAWFKRSARVYIQLCKRETALCHQKHIKIRISTFLKIQGERDEQHCERDDDDRQ